MILVYDEEKPIYQTSKIFEEINEKINKHLGLDLTYNPFDIKNTNKLKIKTISDNDINEIFIDFFYKRKKKGNSYVIGSEEDFQKLPPQKKISDADCSNACRVSIMQW